MTEPGVASRIVKQILLHVGNQPVVKVDVKRTSVTVTFAADDKTVKAYSWVNNSIISVDSDVVDVSQARFDPREFNLSDVGGLFKLAEQLGVSSAEKELQIVEHDPGEVLMSVTTRPESATVFFRKDGTPIKHTDLDTADGLRIGLSDALGTQRNVYAIGFDPEVGVWVDMPNPNSNTLIRRIRQAKLPTYSSPRNQKPIWQTFDATDIDVAVIQRVKAQIQSKYNLSQNTSIVVTIDGHLERSAPTMTFKFGAQSVSTDLRGTDITPWVR